jgi:hypothetical protein
MSSFHVFVYSMPCKRSVQERGIVTDDGALHRPTRGVNRVVRPYMISPISIIHKVLCLV